MLAKQAWSRARAIDRLKARFALVDARVLELSEELDALAASERASKEAPNET
jgi:hypothetical protein